MKIWKKIFSAAAATLCCMFGAMSVKADMIWEPMDSFYSEHSAECTYVNRVFTANGPDGKVILYVSPEVPEPVAVWENGYTAHISFTYEDRDGILWGISDDSDGRVGWVPMDYMEVVYDSIAFREEHAAELVEQAGELEGVDYGEAFYFWEYPGSSVFHDMTMGDYPPSYYCVYTDERGHSWGCVGYYFGIRDIWVCLDEPGADYAQLFPGVLGDGEADTGLEGQKGQTASSEDQESGTTGNLTATDPDVADQNTTEQGAADQDASEGTGAETDSSGEGSVESHGAGQQKDGQETGRIVPKPDNRAMTAAIAMVPAVVAVTAVLLVILKRKGSETPK